jgi:hypothetical protein
MDSLSQWAKIGGILFIILVLIGLGFLIKYILNKRSNLNTPGNIVAIKNSQVSALESRWLGKVQSRAGILRNFQETSTPKPQQLLINTAVFSTRLTGYLGPYDSGVFSEDNAVRIALNAGSRCLILEIDYEHGNYEPKLIYRDSWAIKRSVNTGSIKAVARSIAARAFSSANNGAPESVASDPLIVVLYFLRTPNISKDPIAYAKYLGAVAEQLEPIRELLLGQTPQGDFRRQALESQLFFTNHSVFNNKIIVINNADTKIFRNLSSIGLAGVLGPTQDLDYMTHVRLYGRESPSPFGVTGTSGDSVKPAAVVTSSAYWLNTPTDRAQGAVELTKGAWTLVMPPVSYDTSSTAVDDKKKQDNLFKIYGVHSIPINIFEDAKTTDNFTAKGNVFNNTSWAAKPQLIQYVPSSPIPIQKPFPQANSGGGTIVSPKL